MDIFKDAKWTYNDDGTQRSCIHPLTGRPHVETVNTEPSMTHQEFKDDCDVNLILARFLKTGQMPPWQSQTGVYADLTQLPSYEEAMNTVVHGNRAFEQLPAHIKQRFGQSPQMLMDFLADPANDEEAVKLGLMNPPKPAPQEPEDIKALKEIAKNTARQKKPATPTE